MSACKITPILALALLGLFLADCTSLQRLSPQVRRDYYHDAFVCKVPKRDLQEEYGRYLDSYTKQRLFNANTNRGRRQAFAVITGDSIAGLFRPELLKRFLAEFDILNTGVGGDTSDLFLRRLGKDVLSYRPRVVVLSIGGNDLLRRRCISYIFSNVKLILAQIHRQSPTTQVLLTSVPPVYERRLNSIVLFYNLRLRQLAERSSYIDYIDLWKELAEPDTPRLAKPYRIVSPWGKTDPVHFNIAGYERWAGLLRPRLLRYQNR